MIGPLSTGGGPVQRPNMQPPASVPVENAPASPVDQLPDLSTIENRAAEESGEAAPAEAPLNTGLSTTKKAVLAGVGLATAAMALGASPAYAGDRYHGRGGYGYGYGRGGYNHRPYNPGHHHHGGGNNAGAIIGGIIIGSIIGGAIANQAPPPVYYPPAPQYPQYPQYPQQIRQPFYDNYGRLICPDSSGGWYVSPDNYRCR